MDATLFVHVSEGLTDHEKCVLGEFVANLLSILNFPVDVVLEGTCLHVLTNDEVHVFVQVGVDVGHHIFARHTLQQEELGEELPLIFDLLRFGDRFHAKLLPVFVSAADVRAFVDLLLHLVMRRRVVFLDVEVFKFSKEFIHLVTVHHGPIGARNSILDCR